MSDYERERPSWSDIDKRKDRSPHGSRDIPKNNRPQAERAMTKYKEKLEEMFRPGKKITKIEAKKLKKLVEIADRAEYLAKADEFVEEHGLPNGWEHLEAFLRHKNSEILSETIRRMETLYNEQSNTRQENFRKDLHVIEMSTRDRDLRRQVARLLHQLGDHP